MTLTLSSMLLLLAWCGLWGLGGIWLARASFHLRDSEQVPVGLAMGMVIETLLVNLLAPRLGLPVSALLSAAILFGAGLLAALRVDGWHSLYHIPVKPVQLGILLALFYVFLAINRGLAILDDYAHMPVISLMAAGDIPPHFPLDPSIPYQYHYFLLLFSSQVIRLGGFYPWLALDIGRAISFALGIVLFALWVRRLTGNQTAGLLGGIWSLFAMGTRWLLLLLPTTVLAAISQHIQMIGSGAQSGKTLADAMFNSWAVEGAGPVPYPFAIVNDNYLPAIMAGNSNGLMIVAVGAVLLLTFNRWRGWWSGVALVFLVASADLLSESGPLMSIAAWGLIAVGTMIARRSVRLPRSLWAWLAVVVAGRLLGLMQGGAMAGVVGGWVKQALTGVAPVSYQTYGFKLVFPPELVSGHLGILHLTDPVQLLVALCELGPALIILPLAVVFGWKAYRAGRWYEAAVILGALVTLPVLFIEFTGSNGLRNITRLYEFINLAYFWAFPLAWLWLRRRSRNWKLTGLTLFLISILGGVAIFVVELPAAQKPTTTYFTTGMDVKMAQLYWNRLQPGALVFDPYEYRGPTIFGRPTNSSTTWYNEKDNWLALVRDPKPAAIRAAGFSYVYYDEKYWNKLTPQQQASLRDPCVKQMQEVSDQESHFRRLLDIGACQ